MADWSPAQPLPEGWFGPSFGFDAKGRVKVAYHQVLSLDPVSTRVAVAERQAGSWVDVFERVSTPGDIPVEITLAVGADGTAAACFTAITSLDPATYQVRHYATYSSAATHTWEAPTEIVPPSAASEYVRQRRVCVALNGVAVIVADRFDGPAGNRVGSLVVTSHAPGASWSSPQQLNPVGGLYGAAELGLNAVGDATVAWVHRYQNTPSRSSIRVLTRKASNGVITPSTALTPEDGTVSAGNLVLDVNVNGTAVLGAQIDAQANVTTRDAQTGTWQPFTALFNNATASSSHFRAVGVSPSGMTYALFWRQGPTTSGNDVICAARRGTFGSWSSPKLLSVPNMQLFNGGIAFRGEEAVLVYTGAIGFGGGYPGLGVYQASRWPSFTTDPQPPVDLAEQGPRHSVDQVVGDNAGSVIVVETVWDAVTSRSYATAFDASPPVIVEAVVPATVDAGQVVQLRSKFSDLWSPMGPILWDFGDGTPLGAGGTVTHGWAAPGPYTVTLTGTDSQGNSVTKTFVVTVN